MYMSTNRRRLHIRSSLGSLQERGTEHPFEEHLIETFLSAKGMYTASWRDLPIATCMLNFGPFYTPIARSLE
ncbi:hypothetical protein KSX_02710 [Ktedonospora formicarum]|uniref:Uncharacterized protein n=1 Tax=Ktedonospora formicarum TaxID=2778364 RepID=A0A8J3HWX4_9CHLR|nr:hypothetical protein KSX_02710 [Ktedonospora formicarum]